MRAIAPALARDRIHRIADDLVEGRAAARFNAQVVSSFARLALLLAAIGVYGLTAGEVADRWRELAVRTALGATRRDVLVTAIRPSVGAISLGVAVGIVVTLAVSRSMRAMLHGVTPPDPATLLTVPAILCAVGCFASLLAAVRVARDDPARALRAE